MGSRTIADRAHRQVMKWSVVVIYITVQLQEINSNYKAF